LWAWSRQDAAVDSEALRALPFDSRTLDIELVRLEALEQKGCGGVIDLGIAN
jgi:hypothetical protein